MSKTFAVPCGPNIPKLMIISGIPGSGKSTLARKLVKEYTHAVIVNRDDIRSMLGDYWVPGREPLVTIIENDMILSALNNSYTVIVDATNLNPKTLKRFYDLANRLKIDISIIPIKISLHKAYFRVLWRKLLGGRYISYKVIKDFYNRYKSIQL